MATLKPREKKRKGKDACWLPGVGGLAAYIGYVPCMSVSQARGGIHPITLLHLQFRNRNEHLLRRFDYFNHSDKSWPQKGTILKSDRI
jgi:hypothetical protein